MQLIKPGGHRLFEQDPATAKIVSEMLAITAKVREDRYASDS